MLSIPDRAGPSSVPSPGPSSGPLCALPRGPRLRAACDWRQPEAALVSPEGSWTRGLVWAASSLPARKGVTPRPCESGTSGSEGAGRGHFL